MVERDGQQVPSPSECLARARYTRMSTGPRAWSSRMMFSMSVNGRRRRSTPTESLCMVPSRGVALGTNFERGFLLDVPEGFCYDWVYQTPIIAARQGASGTPPRSGVFALLGCST